jgi:hypothetical protein
VLQQQSKICPREAARGTAEKIEADAGEQQINEWPVQQQTQIRPREAGRGTVKNNSRLSSRRAAKRMNISRRSSKIKRNPLS